MRGSHQSSSLKEQILNKGEKTTLIDVYHYLMIHYGYIPFEEFKKMDANLVDELVGILNKMNEKQNQVQGRKGRMR